MSDVFISYQREDRAAAKMLAEAIERNGWSVWWDRKLHSGEHFDNVIEGELQKAKCVIVLWSCGAVTSQYVKDEANYALKLKKLIPVAIENVEPPFRFQGLHTLSLADWDGEIALPEFQRLVADIGALAGSPLPRGSDQKATTKERTVASERSPRTGIEIYCEKPWSGLGKSPKCEIIQLDAGFFQYSTEQTLRWEAFVFIPLEPDRNYRLRVRRPSDPLSLKATIKCHVSAGEVKRFRYESPAVSFLAGEIKPVTENEPAT